MSNENTGAIVSKPLTELVASQPIELIEQNIQGQETAFQTLMKLALSATTDNDWLDMGGKPYLQGWGAKKIALRFGASLIFDRSQNGEVAFAREDFADEYGPYYVYTVTGKAKIGNREFEAIGTASTRDDHVMQSQYGSDGKPTYKDGKKIKIPISNHEAVQDAKKKAVTNFHNNAIKSILGIGGFSWDDLAKYNISPVGKGKVAYGTSGAAKASSSGALPPAPSLGKDAPAWCWDNDKGERLIFLKEGNHFDEAFINLHKMKPGKKPGVYYRTWDNSLWSAIEKQTAIVEAGAQ